MKAEINDHKQILIIPENGAEAMGLEAWTDQFISGNHSGQIGFILEPLDKDGLIHPATKMRTGEVRASD